MRILIPFGTRPEFVKLASVATDLRAAGHSVTTIATGQHYDQGLAGAFFDELDLQIDERWELPAGEADRVGEILTRAYESVDRHKPEAVLLVGDTNTVPLFCLAARRHRVPVVHLEAGLRSFNPTSLEEVNRKVAAATASLHLAPTPMAASFLEAEGVPAERIRVVGNSVIDALERSGVEPVPVDERSGIVATVHRATNVDDSDRLSAIVALLVDLHRRHGPLVFPVHPRTRSRLEAAGLDQALKAAGVDVREPVPYSEMLSILAASRLCVTDSGGIQEEAAWFGVPAVVLRNSTPRWESVESGIAALVGTDADAALEAAERFLEDSRARLVASTPCPYGRGDTSARVVELLDDPEVLELLRLDEPDRPIDSPR